MGNRGGKRFRAWGAVTVLGLAAGGVLFAIRREPSTPVTPPLAQSSQPASEPPISANAAEPVRQVVETPEFRNAASALVLKERLRGTGFEVRGIIRGESGADVLRVAESEQEREPVSIEIPAWGSEERRAEIIKAANGGEAPALTDEDHAVMAAWRESTRAQLERAEPLPEDEP